MHLLPVRLTDPSVTTLLTGLSAEYHERYGPNSVIADAQPSQFDPPDGAFLVLIEDGRTVAGGGIRRVDADTCEVKRMWTDARFRRMGYARTVLAALEKIAVERGYARVQLETGTMQPEAIALYEHLGYSPIPPYGTYHEALAFERRLTSGIPIRRSGRVEQLG